MGLFLFEDEYDDIYDNENDFTDVNENGEDEQVYRIDAADDFFNGAFDEDGDCVECDICQEGRLRFRNGNWVCQDCGNVINRPEYFNYIGAEPPGEDCITCNNNYPLCKRWCNKY